LINFYINLLQIRKKVCKSGTESHGNPPRVQLLMEFPCAVKVHPTQQNLLGVQQATLKSGVRICPLVQFDFNLCLFH